MLSHWHAKRLILAALDEPLPATRRAWLSSHLGSCASCSAFQSVRRRLAEDLEQTVNQPAMTRSLRDAVLREIVRQPATADPAESLPAGRPMPSRWWWPSTRGNRWLWAPLGLATLTVALVWFGDTSSYTALRVITGQGEVKIIPPSDRPPEGSTPGRPLRPTPLEPGSRVIAETGPVTLSLPRVEVTLERGGELAIGKPERKGGSVWLDKGAITVSVVPGTPWVVRTPLGEARVKGTKFRVSLETRDATHAQGGRAMKRELAMIVTVMSGVVEMVNPMGAVAVAAGETGSIDGREISPRKRGQQLIEIRESNLQYDEQAKMYYREGQPFTGMVCSTYQVGNGPLTRSIMDYRNGRLCTDRAYVSLDQDAKPFGMEYLSREFFNVDGDPDVWKYYFPNGPVQMIQTRPMDPQSGAFDFFEKSGRQVGHCDTKHGKPFQGEMVSYHPDGSVRTIQHYHHGALVPEGGVPGSRVSPASGDWGFTWREIPGQLIVASVAPASPAAEGKFEPRDTIAEVEGRPVGSLKAWIEHTGRFPAGSTLKISVIRHTPQSLQTLTLKLRIPDGSSVAFVPQPTLTVKPGWATSTSGTPTGPRRPGENRAVPGAFKETSEPANLRFDSRTEKTVQFGQPYTGEKKILRDGVIFRLETYRNGEQVHMANHGPDGVKQNEWFVEGEVERYVRYHPNGRKSMEGFMKKDSGEKMGETWWDPEGREIPPPQP